MAEQDVLDAISNLEDKIEDLDGKMDIATVAINADKVFYTKCSSCNTSGMINPSGGCDACNQTGFREHGKVGLEA